MIEISGSAHYDQPASTVFAILTDPPSYPAWQPDVESASLAGDASAQQGARIRQVRKVLGRQTEIALTISELIPGQQLTMATDPGIKPAIRQSWRLQPDDGGCRLDFQLNLDGVPKMAEHLARAQLSRTVPRMLDRLGTVAATR
jgi:ribosome-associated toxin RatA of RatAB toxin-antitoxin module